MATKTTVILLDDVDGSEADESITFSLDGVEYEIDLKDDHANELRETFSHWIGFARKIGGRAKYGSAQRSSPAPRSSTWTAQDRAAMQRWAPNNGFSPPADRGRIAEKLVDAWVSAGKPSE